ncbi:hypothetical protein VaNZ11_005892, partial [Volvox africanus]
MVPWSISAVKNGDVQEPSRVPFKPREAEQVLSEAWMRHADSKSGINSKPSTYRPQIGLSRYQFGDGEYQASVAFFQQHHERQAEHEPLPAMLELVQTTRTLARTMRNRLTTGCGQVGSGSGSGGGNGGGCRSGPMSLASLRRRHSAGTHNNIAAQMFNSSSGGSADGGADECGRGRGCNPERDPDDSEGVQEFNDSDSDSEDDEDDEGDDDDKEPDGGGMAEVSVGSSNVNSHAFGNPRRRRRGRRRWRHRCYFLSATPRCPSSSDPLRDAAIRSFRWCRQRRRRWSVLTATKRDATRLR